jgi:nitrogen permease regulator 2-like protein
VDEPHVKDECGPYVTKPGHAIPPWPVLLHLYSRFKPAKTVAEWIEEYDVHSYGIDVRRLTSFGVIKASISPGCHNLLNVVQGFLQRIHRYPFLDKPPATYLQGSVPQVRNRLNSVSGSSVPISLRSPPSPIDASSIPNCDGNITLRPLASAAGIADAKRLRSSDVPADMHSLRLSRLNRPRRPSAAEKVLEQVRERDFNLKKVVAAAGASPRVSWLSLPTVGLTPSLPPATVNKISSGDETMSSDSHLLANSKPAASVNPKGQHLTAPIPPNSHTADVPPVIPAVSGLGRRPRISRSPSAPVMHGVPIQVTAVAAEPHSGERMEATNRTAPAIPVPNGFIDLLDGEHHSDELAVKFQVGWPMLVQWLVYVGQDTGNGGFGRVAIIHR